MPNCLENKSLLIMTSNLYNQTWNATFATNTGQYRGNDHYTVQHSYIASNATNAGQCPQAVTKTPLDLTATLFDNRNPDPQNTETKSEKNLVSVLHKGTGRFFGIATRIYFPVVANEIYELSFDYFQSVSPTNDGHYFVEVGDSTYHTVLHWVQYPGNAAVHEQVDFQPGGRGAEMDACSWTENVQPQISPASGVWNTGKFILRPRIDSAYLRLDYYVGLPPGATNSL